MTRILTLTLAALLATPIQAFPLPNLTFPPRAADLTRSTQDVAQTVPQTAPAPRAAR